jgi:hypothetical protein
MLKSSPGSPSKIMAGHAQMGQIGPILFTHLRALSSSYPILVPFTIFKENFMKNIKKTSYSRCLIFR